MTSNGDAALTSHPHPLGDAAPSSPRAPPPAPTKLARTASPAPARDRRPSVSRSHHGDLDDAANESEAETVVLGGRDADANDDQLIKTEQPDDDHVRAIKEESRAPNGRAVTADRPNLSTTSAKNGSEQDAKSPMPTSPSSRTTSRHTKETSPTESTKSPGQQAASPPLPSQRGRSASTAESRKRKLRDESHPKSLEPPRQKAKTEGPAISPTPASLARPHKRSQSTQSVAHNGPGRKRKDLTALTLTSEHRPWSESSSERSSSPRPLQTPGLLSHARAKRSNRALTSPARAMTKRNVDKFGATRLARESEKGDLQAVKAAYEAAPDELDQEDFAGIAPLQKAALHGWDDVVEFLLQKGCRTDCESNDRDTPLIDAVENGHLKVVRLLLDQGHVNPHHQNKKGQRAIDVLDLAVDDADEIRQVLLEAMKQHTLHTDNLNSDDYPQPSLHPQNSGSRLLYNEYNMETLIEKAGVGDMAAVGELLNSNIKPNIACGCAAARAGHYDILSILLASGLKADPDPAKHTDTPMSVAIGRGHLKIIKLLLEQDNFNPTRRNRIGQTYYAVSEERQGPRWEQEREMLKNAYDDYMRTHKSPRRVKKETPNPSAVRTKRKSSPPRRERSSSPRHEPKRIKSATMGQGPQKPRRLMSGKEMASRDVKRRRRVVSEDSSDESTDDDVRAPATKIVRKPRSYSEGEDSQPARKHAKASHDAPFVSQKRARARSDDSDQEAQARRRPKIRTKTDKAPYPKPTPTPGDESPDERKTVNKFVRPKSRVLEDKIVNDRPADVSVSVDDMKSKKTPTPSSKSTPAPRENGSTPELHHERQEEAERRAAEAQQKAAEAEMRKHEEREAARIAAEEEARRKAAAEEESRRKLAEAEAEARRQAEEAEVSRQREEEAVRRREAEEAKRQEEMMARQTRLSKLPRALRRACELGTNRPLHFAGEELGISATFLPLFYATANDLRPTEQDSSSAECYIMSFQAVGILGLPELDLARLKPPYCDWERIPVSRKQRELLLRQYDVALLAQEYRFPAEGSSEFDYVQIQESIKEARQRFLDMEGLYWIEDTVLAPEVQAVESLRPLLEDINNPSKRRRINLAECDVESTEATKSRPRKSFMDVLMHTTVRGPSDSPMVNGTG